LPKGTVGRHAEIGGSRIWFAEWGARSTGTPVLLLHGGFGNSNYFGRLIPVLLAHGYRVIAMDSRGHGRSTRSDAPLTYDLMAQDVLGLLDRLGISKVYLVGWSDGGIVGLDLAMTHPDRLAGLFAFGANADVSGLKDGADKTPVFAAYLVRTAEEYRALSPTPRAMGWLRRRGEQNVGHAARLHAQPSSPPSRCPPPSRMANSTRRSNRPTMSTWRRRSPALTWSSSPG
jgi:pimeloyl-ACP methyl ester carboxylesterase